LTIGKLSLFKKKNEDVLKLEVKSQCLRKLNKAVGKVDDLPGETFKKYKPHITVAYVKKDSVNPAQIKNMLEGRSVSSGKLVHSSPSNHKTILKSK
jgi:2'-5' RNA ligase